MGFGAWHGCARWEAVVLMVMAKAPKWTGGMSCGSGSPVLLEGRSTRMHCRKRKTVSRPIADGGVLVKGRCNAVQEGEEPTLMPACDACDRKRGCV